MIIAKIETMQTGDATEMTDNIWFSGCSRHCPSCHNKNLWFKQGTYYTAEALIEQLSGIRWVALMGGEPMEQKETGDLIIKLKDAGKKVLLFSTYVPVNYPDHLHLHLLPDVKYLITNGLPFTVSVTIVIDELPMEKFIEMLGNVYEFIDLYIRSNDFDTMPYINEAEKFWRGKIYNNEKVKL